MNNFNALFDLGYDKFADTKKVLDSIQDALTLDPSFSSGTKFSLCNKGWLLYNVGAIDRSKSSLEQFYKKIFGAAPIYAQFLVTEDLYFDIFFDLKQSPKFCYEITYSSEEHFKLDPFSVSITIDGLRSVDLNHTVKMCAPNKLNQSLDIRATYSELTITDCGFLKTIQDLKIIKSSPDLVFDLGISYCSNLQNIRNEYITDLRVFDIAFGVDSQFEFSPVNVETLIIDVRGFPSILSKFNFYNLFDSGIKVSKKVKITCLLQIQTQYIDLLRSIASKILLPGAVFFLNGRDINTI